MVAVVVVVVLVVVAAVSTGCSCNICGSGGTTYNNWWGFLVTVVTVMRVEHISYLH